MHALLFKLAAAAAHIYAAIFNFNSATTRYMSKLHISFVQLCARLTVCTKTKKKACRSRQQFRMIAAAHKDTNSMQMNPECTLHNAHARKFVTWKWCDKTSTVVAFHTHAIFARFGSYFCDRSYVVCARHVYFRNSCILHTNTPRNKMWFRLCIRIACHTVHSRKCACDFGIEIKKAATTHTCLSIFVQKPLKLN